MWLAWPNHGSSRSSLPGENGDWSDPGAYKHIIAASRHTSSHNFKDQKTPHVNFFQQGLNRIKGNSRKQIVWKSCVWQRCMSKTCVRKRCVWQRCASKNSIWTSCVWQNSVWKSCVWQTCMWKSRVRQLCAQKSWRSCAIDLRACACE